MKNYRKIAVTAAFLALVSCEPALAGGSGSSVKTLMQEVLDILSDIGIIVVTLGLLYGGYKIIFKGANIMDVAGPVLGCVVVGASPWIASQLLG